MFYGTQLLGLNNYSLCIIASKFLFIIGFLVALRRLKINLMINQNSFFPQIRNFSYFEVSKKTDLKAPGLKSAQNNCKNFI